MFGWNQATRRHADGQCRSWPNDDYGFGARSGGRIPLNHAVSQNRGEKTDTGPTLRLGCAVSVSAALEAFLDGRELDGREQVLSEIARALARQLDSAGEAGTARGMSACPPLARRLGEVVDALVARQGGRDGARGERGGTGRAPSAKASGGDMGREGNPQWRVGVTDA